MTAHANDATPPAPNARPYELPVRYGDTDQMGFAYYANYLYWFEIARTEWLRAGGLTYREIEAQGVRLPVTEAHCRYLVSARYDDRLRLWAWVSELGRATVQFDYRIDRAADGVVVARGSTKHCFLDASGRPTRPSGSLREHLTRGMQPASLP